MRPTEWATVLHLSDLTVDGRQFETFGGRRSAFDEQLAVYRLTMKSISVPFSHTRIGPPSLFPWKPLGHQSGRERHSAHRRRSASLASSTGKDISMRSSCSVTS